MKKRYSFHHLKNVVIGATATMAISAICAPPAMAISDPVAYTVSDAKTVPYGLNYDDTLTVTSTGSITIVGEGTEIFGVGVLGDFNGTISNSGLIRVTATNGTNSDASAFGIGIDGDLLGSLTNNGTISATATSTSSYDAIAAGIGINGDLTGTLTNNGTITTSVTSNSAAEGYGIVVEDDLSANASITNSGAINVTANAEDWGYVYGIRTDNLGENASITNSGTITLRATSIDDDSATGFGIQTGALGVGASVRNSGVIDITIISHNSSPDNYGISTGNLDDNATITNSGTINVTTQILGNGSASYGGWASATGLRAGYLSAGAAITNSGTITATAEADGGDFGASVAGVIVYGLGSGASFRNDGTITATATATAYGAWAAGLNIYNMADGASIINNGTILAEANGDGAEGGATGIRLSNLDENDIVTNNGTITATINSTGDENVNHQAYSIYIDNDYGTGGTVTNNGILNGNINLDGGNTYSSGGEGGYSTSGVVNLNNNGTLAIPALAEGEAGWISGDYTQSAAGIFKIGVDSNTEYGRLEVGGTATLPDDANIRVNVAPDNTLVAGTLENIIDASMAPTTLYSGPTYNVMDNSLAWQFTASQDDDDALDLTVSAPTGMSTYVDAVTRGGLSSGAGVAGVLDDFYANGAPDSTFDDLLYVLGSNDTPSEVADDVSKLLPLMSGGLSQAAFSAMHGSNRIIQARLEANQGLSFGDEVQPDRHMWIKPFGAWTDQDDADGAIGYNANTYGVVLGADTNVSNSGFRLGAAFVYSASDVDSNSDIAPQSADINNYQFAFYGSYSLDEQTDINFQADIGTSDYDGVRTISFDSYNARANSDFDSTNYHLGAGLGRDIKIDDKNTFTPSVRADYTAIDTDSYTETGAESLNLNVEGETYEELIFAVDGKISHDLNKVVGLTGNLGLGVDAINDQGTITSNFVGGGGSFVTDGIDPSALLFRGGLGLTMQPGDGVELVARYDLEAREDFANHTLSMKFRMPF